MQGLEKRKKNDKVKFTRDISFLELCKIMEINFSIRSNVDVAKVGMSIQTQNLDRSKRCSLYVNAAMMSAVTST